MTTAKDIMTADPITVKPETEINEAARLLLEKNINGVPVVNDHGELMGIICQSDLVAMQRKIPLPSIFTLFDSLVPLSSTSRMEKEIKKIAATRVGEVMTRDPLSVDPNTSLEELAEIMVMRKFHTLPVVENRRLVGVVGKADVLKTIMRQE
jgi:CBS domain-containing protein